MAYDLRLPSKSTLLVIKCYWSECMVYRLVYNHSAYSHDYVEWLSPALQHNIPQSTDGGGELRGLYCVVIVTSLLHVLMMSHPALHSAPGHRDLLSGDWPSWTRWVSDHVITMMMSLSRDPTDSYPSSCYIFYKSSDMNTNRLSVCQCVSTCHCCHRYFLKEITDDIFLKHKTDMLHEMERFVTSSNSCRRRWWCHHFSTNYHRDNWL